MPLGVNVIQEPSPSLIVASMYINKSAYISMEQNCFTSHSGLTLFCILSHYWENLFFISPWPEIHLNRMKTFLNATGNLFIWNNILYSTNLSKLQFSVFTSVIHIVISIYLAVMVIY